MSLTRRPSNSFRARLTAQRGSALIEFALASMLFFVMVFGVFEGARAVFLYNVLASSAREGARFAIVRGSTSGRTATDAQVQAAVLAKAVGLNPTVSVTWSPNKDPGGTVQVQVSKTFTSVIPFVPIGTIPMSATARMMVLR